MHLISTIPGGWNPNDEGVFYIQQKPGDVLFLSAADTDLYILNKVYKKLYAENNAIPSLRLANLTYFKQELTIDTYIEEVVSKAKVVVLKLLGGTSYFSYLCEAIADYAEENNIQLIFMPGDDKPDLELMQLSTISLHKVDRIWNYLMSGGMENTEEGLKQILNSTLAVEFQIKEKINTPDLFLFHPKEGVLTTNYKQPNQPLAIIIGYRSYYLADNLEPILNLTQKLAENGVLAITVMALSYRDKNSKNNILNLLKEHQLTAPKVIINTTGFSIQSFNETTENGLFDTFNVPVIQAIMASCNKQTWANGSFGLPPTDVAMNIALPEVDGKIISTVISFKEALEKDVLTDSEVVKYVAFDEGCSRVAKQAKAWVTLNSKKNKDKKIALVVPNYPNKNSRLANGVGLDTPQSTVDLIHELNKVGYDLGTEIPNTVDELITKLTDHITNDLIRCIRQQ